MVVVPLRSSTTKKRFGLRVDRLRPAPSPTLIRHPSCVRGSDAPARLWPQTIFTLPFPLYPRHLRLRLRCRVRSHSSVPRNLRLLFRAVDVGLLRSFLHFTRMPYCQQRSSHPQRMKPPTIQALGIIHYSRKRICPKPPLSASPKPRCTVRRCTDSTPAVGQPLHSLRVCLRIRARAGRLTVCGASSSTESLSLRTYATPAVCANPDVGTPSSLRSFG